MLRTAPQSAMGSMENFVGDLIMNLLMPYAPHILGSCEQFASQAKTLVMTPDDFFMRLDVQNFFTRGEPSDFCEALNVLTLMNKLRVF